MVAETASCEAAALTSQEGVRQWRSRRGQEQARMVPNAPSTKVIDNDVISWCCLSLRLVYREMHSVPNGNWTEPRLALDYIVVQLG